MVLPTPVYQEIVSNDVSGGNHDPVKANLMRRFIIPDRFKVDYSHDWDSSKPRTIRLYAAWVSDNWTYALSDFSGLVRFHVVSRDGGWSKADLDYRNPQSVCLPPLFLYIRAKILSSIK